MPQTPPTKQEFEAAFERVIKTAPDGLNEEQLLDLVEKELKPSTVSPVSDEEPGTWMGGFTKHINEGMHEAGNAMFKSMSQPETIGDFAGLALPGAYRGAKAGAEEFVSRSGGAAKEAWKDTPPGLLGTISAPFKSVGKFKESLPSQIDKDISAFRGPKGPSVGATQVEMNTDRGAFDRAPLDKPKAKPQSPMDVGRLAGKAPTVDDALMDALTGAMGGDKPMAVSHTPEALTAGEGALKQSGKFGKSGSMGQAGGYSSGRPSTQPSEHVPSEPPLTVEEVVGDARRGFGSRDAGGQLEGTPYQRKEAIREMAPGESQTPFDAELRIQEARRKAAQDTGSPLNLEILQQLINQMSGRK